MSDPFAAYTSAVDVKHVPSETALATTTILYCNSTANPLEQAETLALLGLGHVDSPNSTDPT